MPGELTTANIWIPIQDYKSILTAVMICATVVNTQTDRQLLIVYTISSACSCDKNEK